MLVDIGIAMLATIMTLIGKPGLHDVVKRLFLIKHCLLVGRNDILCKSA